MKKKPKFYTAKNAVELAKLLGLSEQDGVEIELRTNLNLKIIEVVRKRRLTHQQVADLASTSRTKITALLNANTKHISTSLMIRILAALGIRVRLSYSPIKVAA